MEQEQKVSGKNIRAFLHPINCLFVAIYFESLPSRELVV
jgi:hypothetical protein